MLPGTVLGAVLTRLCSRELDDYILSVSHGAAGTTLAFEAFLRTAPTPLIYHRDHTTRHWEISLFLPW